MIPDVKSISIAFIVGLIIGAWASNDYTSLYYKEKIERDSKVQEIAAREASERVLARERSYEETINVLNQKVASEQAAVSSLRSQLGGYVDKYNRLRLKPNAVCVQDTRASSTASDVANTETPAEYFSEGFTEFLERTNSQITQLQIYADTCYKYTSVIQKQRKEMMENNKNE